jgi:hypothetical protein
MLTTLPKVCTLRAAIQEYNALPGVDTTNNVSGTDVLSMAGRQENVAAAGDLDITDRVNIFGVP